MRMLNLAAVPVVLGCGLEAPPVEPPEPGLDAVWVATSFTVTDQLSAPRMVSDGQGGMREVPREFEMIGRGGSVILTIRLDGTYSRQAIMPGFSDRGGSEVGEFILQGDTIVFRESAGFTDRFVHVAQQGDDLTLTSDTETWDFDEDGTISAAESATIVEVYRRSN